MPRSVSGPSARPLDTPPPDHHENGLIKTEQHTGFSLLTVRKPFLQRLAWQRHSRVLGADRVPFLFLRSFSPTDCDLPLMPL
jgi:hypothetical protein